MPVPGHGVEALHARKASWLVNGLAQTEISLRSENEFEGWPKGNRNVTAVFVEVQHEWFSRRDSGRGTPKDRKEGKSMR